MSLRWCTPAQFRGLFRRAGLAVDALYGDCRGGPYRAPSPCLIVAGHAGAKREA